MRISSSSGKSSGRRWAICSGLHEVHHRRCCLGPDRRPFHITSGPEIFTPFGPKGVKISGPEVIWKGRRSGPRQHRRWCTSWSPEQIAQRLPLDFPDDEEMRISHEAVYQALYVQGRGALRRELTACLRTGRALRMPRARVRGRGKPFVSPEVMISERPAEAD